MRLVRLSDGAFDLDKFLGVETSHDFDGCVIHLFENETIATDDEYKKVLDAISGSEEHLDELTDKAVIEMLYKTINKLTETNETLTEYIKSSQLQSPLLGQPDKQEQ